MCAMGKEEEVFESKLSAREIRGFESDEDKESVCRSK